MNTTQIGNQGEKMAQKFLKSNRYEILEHNSKICGVEVDIIAKSKEGTIVFCEVKTRNSDKFGLPKESVDYFKQQRYIKAGKMYLSAKHLYDVDLRFDVIEIFNGEINHIVSAFEV